MNIKDLIGTWDVTSYIAGKKKEAKAIPGWLEYTFNADGSVNEVGTKGGKRMTDKVQRSWKAEGDRINLYQEKKALMYVHTLTKDTLVLSTEKGDLIYNCKRKA